MKKIISLTVLVLFLVSMISITIAQNGQTISIKNRERIIDCACTTEYEPVCGSNGVTYVNKCRAGCAGVIEYDEGKCNVTRIIQNIDPVLQAKLLQLSRARQTEIANLNKTQLEQRLREIQVKKVQNAEQLKERVLSKQRIETARQNFINARELCEIARQKYNEAKKGYMAAKESGDNEATLEHAKEVMLSSVEKIISHLEKIKAKIEENENMDEERANDLIEKIDNQISDMEEIKAKIEAAETRDQLKEVAKEFRNKWNRYRYRVHAFAEMVVNARVRGVVNQALVLEKKLDHALAIMEEKGIEVDVETEVDEFSSLIEQARDKIGEAQEKLEQAINETDKETTRELAEEAKSLIDEARDLIREAHNKLKEIVAKIREAGQELEIDETVEVEIEEEAATTTTTIPITTTTIPVTTTTISTTTSTTTSTI